ncbi:MAG: CrcB family protein [Naasia sp.]|nr:CrcB family protein [Naasia sp.]
MTARQSPPRAAHLDPVLLAAVAVGGAAGTAARMGITNAIPVWDLPFATLLVNVTGAFALGLLLAALGGSSSDTGPRRASRLLLGSGFLGGFTTYSQLALDAANLLFDGRGGLALLYAAATLALGIGAAAAGMLLARGRHSGPEAPR